jgi:DNA-binding HxlR family transcriptional regulator
MVAKTTHASAGPPSAVDFRDVQVLVPMSGRQYNQYCPVALALDVVGERWTILILRELLGGPRRYADLKAALPGIATNLLADRLRELADRGLVNRQEVPPPVARTVYELSDDAWGWVPRLLLALGAYGVAELRKVPHPDPVPPLTAFLVGVLMRLSRHETSTVTARFDVRVDDQVFGVSVVEGRLSRPQGNAELLITCTAEDLLAAHIGDSPQTRDAANRRIHWSGDSAGAAQVMDALGVTSQVPTH